MSVIEVRPIIENDRQWLIQIIKEEWESNIIITRGKVYNVDQLPGFIAIINNKKVGVITYKIHESECEIITLNSLISNIGIGTELLIMLEKHAISLGCTRLWVITTNDNTEALRFYQMKGFNISAIYINAIKKSRKLKPEIPLLGINDIEIKDEIELEKSLK